MSKLVVFLSLLSFGLAAPAFGQPDANPSLVGDCDDTYATKSNDEYICEQAQTAAQQATLAADNTSGERWICVEIVTVLPDQVDDNGWATVEPLFDDYARAIWLNMAALNRFDRIVDIGGHFQTEVILPPWAMRVSPVFSLHGGIHDQRYLARNYRRLADDVCHNSRWAGHPDSVDFTPEPMQ